MFINFDDGRCYDIRFEYNKRDDHGGVVDTKCFVSVVTEGSNDNFIYAPLHEGLAIQNPKDNHVKAIARKVSLANAIAPVSEDDRKEIWEQYNAQVKK